MDPACVLTHLPSKNGDTDDKPVSLEVDKMTYVSLCGDVLRNLFSSEQSPSVFRRLTTRSTCSVAFFSRIHDLVKSFQ